MSSLHVVKTMGALLGSCRRDKFTVCMGNEIVYLLLQLDEELVCNFKLWITYLSS